MDGSVLGKGDSWQRAVLGGLVIAPTVGRLIGWDHVYASDGLAGWETISLQKGIIAGLLVGLGSRVSNKSKMGIDQTSSDQGARVDISSVECLEVLKDLW